MSVPRIRNPSCKRIHISNSPNLEPKEENHIALKNDVPFTYYILSLAARKQILFSNFLRNEVGDIEIEPITIPSSAQFNNYLLVHMDHEILNSSHGVSYQTLASLAFVQGRQTVCP